MILLYRFFFFFFRVSNHQHCDHLKAEAWLSRHRCTSTNINVAESLLTGFYKTQFVPSELSNVLHAYSEDNLLRAMKWKWLISLSLTLKCAQLCSQGSQLLAPLLSFQGVGRLETLGIRWTCAGILGLFISSPNLGCLNGRRIIFFFCRENHWNIQYHYLARRFRAFWSVRR